MASTRFGRFQVDVGGVREVLKAGPTEALLKQAAESIAGPCCSACYADRGTKGHVVSQKEPFNAWTSIGGYTAIGHVSTVNMEGWRFESKSKVLESYNH